MQRCLSLPKPSWRAALQQGWACLLSAGTLPTIQSHQHVIWSLRSTISSSQLRKLPNEFAAWVPASKSEGAKRGLARPLSPAIMSAARPLVSVVGLDGAPAEQVALPQVSGGSRKRWRTGSVRSGLGRGAWRLHSPAWRPRSIHDGRRAQQRVWRINSVVDEQFSKIENVGSRLSAGPRHMRGPSAVELQLQVAPALDMACTMRCASKLTPVCAPCAAGLPGAHQERHCADRAHAPQQEQAPGPCRERQGRPPDCGRVLGYWPRRVPYPPRARWRHPPRRCVERCRPVRS